MRVIDGPHVLTYGVRCSEIKLKQMRGHDKLQLRRLSPKRGNNTEHAVIGHVLLNLDVTHLISIWSSQPWHW